jgi:site-specific DNA-cytosine methylase
MNVLSLFNGMNTGRQALENVGIKVKKYYSSEIKPYAIELTQHHFPLRHTHNCKSWKFIG